MKKTKALIGIMILLITTLMYGCGGQTPTDTVEEYFKKVQKGDTDVEDLFMSISEDVEESDEFPDEISKKLLDAVSKLTYTINSETITEDTAKVNVSVNGADLSIVMANVIQEAFTYAISQVFSGVEMTEEESDNYFNTILSEKLDEITYSDRSGDISLTKVDGEWKISENDALTSLILGLDSSLFEENGILE